MTALNWIIFAAGLAYLIYEMRLKDAHKASLQEIWTIPNERNWIFRGEDGYYSETKGWVVDGIVVGAGFLSAILIDVQYVPMVVGLVFAGIGGALHIMQAKDWKRFKKNLAAQEETLRKLKADPNSPIEKPRLVNYGKVQHFVSGTFYDFHERRDIPLGLGVEIFDYPEQVATARAEISTRLAKLAQKPESEWFKEDRSKSV